jgi:Asp-tRNA(Asn)/Glu-tRNA(Gln) amidotransferase C subunit
MKVQNRKCHVAHLARLNMDESMVVSFTSVGKILEYVETLNALDTAGVVPTLCH